MKILLSKSQVTFQERGADVVATFLEEDHAELELTKKVLRHNKIRYREMPVLRNGRDVGLRLAVNLNQFPDGKAPVSLKLKDTAPKNLKREKEPAEG